VASALPRFSVRSNRNSYIFFEGIGAKWLWLVLFLDSVYEVIEIHYFFEGIGAKWLWLVLFLDSVYEVIEIHCSFLIVASNST
jgi:hypothetical protein